MPEKTRETIEEQQIVELYLEPMGQDRPCKMVQVGANEGMYEYAKPDGKDFVFEFLKKSPAWSALLIEPNPDIFERLKKNYAEHTNTIHFLNCAITDDVETRTLKIVGKDGKSSTLIEGWRDDRATDRIKVDCIPLNLACGLVNFSDVDFLKVDAEGYDEEIVAQAFSAFGEDGMPKIILWEQTQEERLGLPERFEALGYTVLRSGKNKKGWYMDMVAISNAVLRDHPVASNT